jgi:uncharacterized protein (DUF1800 family)
MRRILRMLGRRLVLLPALAALCLSSAIAHQKISPPKNDRESALELLNRLTFGPRPGDIDRVLGIGIDKWIDQQLHPESIADHALDARLSPFRTLRMNSRELAENFPPQAVIRQVAEGKQQLPQDPPKRAIYETQLEKFREKQDQTAAGSYQNAAAQRDAVFSGEDRSETLALPPDQRMHALLAMTPKMRLKFFSSLKGPARDGLLEGMSREQQEIVAAIENPRQVVAGELMQAKLLRAVYSERQLQEVMTDFWINHFNVFIGKGADRYDLIAYERDVIRPRAMGKFEDLLVATAQSPAMLFYLDNWLSVGPDSDFANGIHRGYGQRRMRHLPAARPSPQPKRRSGLNENYGRELMELHTLGVNGGYTQEDVTEVAKVFTGWTLEQPLTGGGFKFDERMHERGTKIVLGHKIKERGEKEGYEVLDILARHPSTAKFICTKLGMRFVSDNPPPALVDRMARTYLKKNGDIREVLKTMLESPEFWAPETHRAKVKTPFEFTVSALRATNAEVRDATGLVRQLAAMGMPLYGSQPPTGYSMKAESWVSSSALLGRMNFSIRLASGKIRGVEVPPWQPLGGQSADPQQMLTSLENTLLAGEVSKQTHETISSRLDDPTITRRKLDDSARPPDVALIEGLLLGAPEFQRR